MQRVSSTPTSLTVVGPEEKEEFYEILCAGMDYVTSGFGSYDLAEICEEYIKNAENKKDVVPPKRVGGSRVHLLLGIKNTNLDLL